MSDVYMKHHITTACEVGVPHSMFVHTVHVSSGSTLNSAL